MRNLILGFVIAMTFAPAALAATSNLNPAFLKLKIYKVAVSTSPLCTNPTTVFTTTSPVYTDFLGAPTLGSGSVVEGTYHCVIIEFEDTIQAASMATTTNGGCTANLAFSLDVCRAPTTTTLLNGTVTTCAGTGDRIAMYLSTTAIGGNGANAFEAPTTTNDASKGFRLGSPLVVTSGGSGTFVVDGTGGISESNSGGGAPYGCEMDAPSFSFR